MASNCYDLMEQFTAATETITSFKVGATSDGKSISC